MSWITLTTNDIYLRMSSAELDLLANSQLEPGAKLNTSEGQTVTSGGQQFMLTPPVVSVVDDTLNETALEIRAACSAGGYALDASPKIPEILKGYALSIMPFKLWSRLGGEFLDFADARRTLYDRALEVIRLVEQGRYDAIPKASGSTPQLDTPSFGYDEKLAL